jgi:hypothetical protein
VFGAAAQRTLQQPIAEPLTGGAGRQEQQEQAKFRQQLSAGWVQSQSRLIADRQSGLTQQPPSELNGADAEVSAEADAVAERKDNVSVIPMKVGGVDVRDRRTAEAEQAEDTTNSTYLLRRSHFREQPWH